MSTDGLVYLVCDVMNNTPTQLSYESVNEGRNWSADNPPPPQPPHGVTAIAGLRFAWNSGPDLYMLTRHGWHLSLTDRGHGFSLVGFETNLGRFVGSFGCYNPRLRRQIPGLGHLARVQVATVPSAGHDDAGSVAWGTGEREGGAMFHRHVDTGDGHVPLSLTPPQASKGARF